MIAAEELSQTPEASPELTKRSWFGSLMSTDRDETYTIIVKEKPLASIKADLIQAFLSVIDAFFKTYNIMFENHSKRLIWIFEFWHSSPIFVLLKLTCLVTLFDRKF